MKNNVEQFTSSDPIVQKLKDIERRLAEYKFTQAPTVRLSNMATITFSLYDDFINAGGTFPDLFATATLSPPTDQNIMAIPEWNLYWGSAALTPEDEGSLHLGPADRVFPGGNRFSDYASLPDWYLAVFAPTISTAKYGALYLSLCWWYDYWNTILDNSEQKSGCRIRIDAALMNGDFPSGQFAADWAGMGFTLTSRWRYLLPGAST